MIKKCLVILFAMLGVITHANANIKISPEAADSAIREIFSQEKDKASALATFKANLQADGGISALSIWKVCAAGGLDYDKNAADKTKCKQLQKKLLKEGSVTYFEVCGKDKGKSKGTEYCVDDFFTNKFIGGTQVQMSTAIALAQEYARIKDKDDSVTCSSAYREVGNDEAIKCASKNRNAFYEFVFDDVKETSDDTIRKSSQTAVCKMYGVESVEPICDSANGRCIGGVCKADAQTCPKINESLQKFGLSSKFVNGKCSVNYERLTDKKQLKTAFGIDNFAFCKGMGIQVGNEPAVDKYLKDYVAKQAGISASEVTCDPGFKTYTGQGCNVGMFAARDDVKTCHAKGQQIDFVFDDINELWETYKKGGVQAMSCKVSGGTYAGKRCIGLGKQQCDVLRKSNIATCPQCKAAEWDEATQSCVLPSAADVAALEKGVNISLMVGGAVVGVVVTVATGGAGAAIVLTGIETVGSAMEITSQLQINGMADDFLVESNKCRSASCAERIITQDLQRMSNIANDLLEAESTAIDSELARLAGLLPNNSPLLQKMAGVDGSTLDKNNKGFFDADSWEPEQVWRAVGVALQLASVAASVGKWVVGKTGMLAKRMPQATEALASKTRALVKVEKVGGALDATKVGLNSVDNVDDALKMANKVGGGIYDAAYFSKSASAVDDIFKNTDNLVQIKRADISGSTLRDIMRKAQQQGFECIDCAGDILKFSKKSGTVADTGADISNTARKVVNNVDNAPSASVANKVVDTATDAATKADDAAKAASSWADDLASIGVKEVDGVYTDIKTGKELTEAQVLNRIPSSLNDELAEIGIRQVDRGKYGTRYIDTATGQSVSSDEVVKRIGNMSSDSAARKGANTAANVGADAKSTTKNVTNNASNAGANTTSTTKNVTNNTSNAGANTTSTTKNATNNTSNAGNTVTTTNNTTGRFSEVPTYDEMVDSIYERFALPGQTKADFVKQFKDKNDFYDKAMQMTKASYDDELDMINSALKPLEEKGAKDLYKTAKEVSANKQAVNFTEEERQLINEYLNLQSIKAHVETGKANALNIIYNSAHDAGNLEKLANDSQKQIARILADNPRLKQNLSNFKNLTKNQQQRLAEDMVNSVAQSRNLKIEKIGFLDDTNLSTGFYRASDNGIYLNLKRIEDGDDLMDVINHELTHTMQNQVPKESIYGESISRQGWESYVSRHDYKVAAQVTPEGQIDTTKRLAGRDMLYDAYRNNPLEREAWVMGSNGKYLERADAYSKYRQIEKDMPLLQNQRKALDDAWEKVKVASDKYNQLNDVRSGATQTQVEAARKTYLEANAEYLRLEDSLSDLSQDIENGVNPLERYQKIYEGQM